jgi:hypothetical protein
MTKTDRYSVQTDEDTPTPQMPNASDIFIGRAANIPRRPIERTRFGAFKITPKGLEISEGAQEKDWREAGEFIFQVESGIQWLIGDWLAYGDEVKWGNTDEIAANLGKEPQTLYNYTTVAKAIEFSRRRENVSFSHHGEVMGLTSEEQEYALSYVARNRMSQKDFRKWIKLGMPEEGLPKSLPASDQSVDASPVEREYNIAKLTDNVYGVAQKDLTRIPLREIRAALDDLVIIERKNAEAKVALLDALRSRGE